MIINWTSFNESKSDYPLTKDLISDYFLTINDMGQSCVVEYCVYVDYDFRNWIPFSDCDIESINRIGYSVLVSLQPYRINSMEELDRHLLLVQEVRSICNRIVNNYDVSIHFIYEDSDETRIVFECVPTLFDACYISYNYFIEYMPNFIDVKGCTFRSEGGDYFIDLPLFMPQTMSLKEFRKKLEDHLDGEEISFKYESYNSEYEAMGNKYILKNFVLTNEINFKY